MKLNYSFPKSFKKFSGLFFLILLLLLINSRAESTTVTITVANFEFSPSNVSVNIGDSIKFQWLNGSHTTTCDGIFSGTSLPPGAATWDTPMNSANPEFIYQITVSGTYNYVCIPHSPAMAGTIVASAGSLLTENFSYPVGDSLGAHGWVSYSGGSTNYLAVTSPGMVYSGYVLSNIGNATKVVTSGQDAYKAFSQPDSTGSLYVSFMVNVASAQAGDYFFALLPPTSTTLYTSRFYAKDSLGGLSFGLSKSTAAAGGIFYTAGTFSFGTTYLVVIKYEFVTGGTNDDIMKAFIFSSGVPSTEPPNPTIGPVTGTAPDNTLGRIALRQGTSANAPVANVDGFRASTSWDFTSTSVSNLSTTISDNFYLAQNYPNPFNPNTTIRYNIVERGFVNLTVYNSLGKEVKNLINSNAEAGSYSVDFNGSGLNSGIYFYKITYINKSGNSFTDTKKLILLK